MLARGVLKSQIGKGLDIGLAFVISVFLTRWLGPERYGGYILILGWLSMAGLLISLGFSESLNRYLPQLVSSDYAPESLLWPLLGLRLTLVAAIGASLYLGGPALFNLVRQPSVTPFVAPILLLFTLMQIAALLWSYFIAQMEIDVTIRANVARHLTVLLFGAWWVWRGASEMGDVLLLVSVGYAVAVAIYVRQIGRQLRPRSSWPLQRLKEVMSFGVSAWGVSFVTFMLAEQSDVLLLGFLVEDTRAVAYYQVGTSLVWKLLGVITVGSQVVLATLSTLRARRGSGGLAHGWQVFVKLSTIAILPAYAFVGWHAPAIVRIVYGPAYEESALVLRIFLILMVVPVGLLGGGLHLMALYALGRERTGLIARVIAGLTNLILGVVLIGRMGAVGAVIATGTAMMVGTGLEFLALRRVQPLVYPWRFVLRVLGAVGVGTGIMVLVQVQTIFELLVTGLLFSAVVLLFLRRWRPLIGADVEMLKGISPRLAAAAELFAKSTVARETGS